MFITQFLMKQIQIFAKKLEIAIDCLCYAWIPTRIYT